MALVRCELKTADGQKRIYADLYRDTHKSGSIWTYTKQGNEFVPIKKPQNVQVFYAPIPKTPVPSRSRSRSRTRRQ